MCCHMYVITYVIGQVKSCKKKQKVAFIIDKSCIYGENATFVHKKLQLQKKVAFMILKYIYTFNHMNFLGYCYNIQ